jgi:Kef-type K+ transport system membrane component KefB
MKKVALYSMLLVLGLFGSQWLPLVSGETYPAVSRAVLLLTMIALAFIMIHVGYEFELDKSNLRQYGWDYVVAFTAASFPWLFVTLYFVYVMLPPEFWTSWGAWKETLLVGRFASPTSAGVLFSMLAAAGLSATWMFKKARILAIFDDLDTVLLMVPLQMVIIGWAWQLSVAAVIMIGLLVGAYIWLHRLPLPISWRWVLGYAAAITGVCELILLASKMLNESAPIHVEVLLPAFVLGCLMKRPSGSNPHRDDMREGHQEGPESVNEQQVSTIVSAVFMVLVGLNMPPIFSGAGAGHAVEGEVSTSMVTASQPPLGWGAIMVHVLLVTVLANLGKMVPALCYRHEAPWRERLALAIGMWPRGEVGAGILVISLSYGIGGPILTVAMLSLALNLLFTGLFIVIVKKLMQTRPVAGMYSHLLERGNVGLLK